jgi:hypothetical protein
MAAWIEFVDQLSSRGRTLEKIDIPFGVDIKSPNVCKP